MVLCLCKQSADDFILSNNTFFKFKLLARVIFNRLAIVNGYYISQLGFYSNITII